MKQCSYSGGVKFTFATGEQQGADSSPELGEADPTSC